MLQIIPETHTLGSINPHTLFIDLHSTTEAEIVRARAGGGNPAGWELYEHEARHWRDLLATVWGRRYLDLLFRTYDLLLQTPKNKMETTYKLVLELFDVERAILFPSYYKYVLSNAPKADPANRWSMGFSHGVKVAADGSLDAREPILFVRFDEGKTHFARQPLSVGSLIEGRALAAEIAALAEWLKFRAADEAVVTWHLKEPELARQFYDPELTTYSVASHVISYAADVQNVRSAMNLSNKLADIALNLSETGFANLQPPPDLGEFSLQTLRGFRRDQNRGFAFCCMAFALRPHIAHLRGGEIGRDIIESALKTAKLPTISKIYADARAVIDRVPGRAAVDPMLKAIRLKLLSAGRALHEEPDFDSSVASLCPAGAAPAPLVCDSSCKVFSLGRSPLTELDSDYLYERHEQYREVLRSALRAARGLDFEFTDYVY